MKVNRQGVMERLEQRYYYSERRWRLRVRACCYREEEEEEEGLARLDTGGLCRVSGG